MDRARFFSLSIVSFFLISIVVIGIVLHYPLNLIVDGIALAVAGMASIIYIVIWSFLGDRIILFEDRIKVVTRSFPFWTIHERTIYFREISNYTIKDSDLILMMKTEDIVHIDKPESKKGVKINDLSSILGEKGIQKMEYKDFMRKSIRDEESYLTRI